MDTTSCASHEALLYTLSSDTLIVLNRVSLGLSNRDIVKWSAGWSFSEEKIEKLLAHAYEKLDLKVSKPHLGMREALSVFMDECRQKELFTPSFIRGVDGVEREKKKQSNHAKTPRVNKPREELYRGFDINNREFKSTLSKNIRLVAKLRKMLLGEIAEKAGLHPMFMTFLKYGDGFVNIERLTALSEAVGVRVDFLATPFLRESDEVKREIEQSWSST